jgi:3-hydroxyacyl-CoA dehydrogenase
VERCTLALINEGARLLDEGIATSAADIDVIWCNGYGFPRWRGGPMVYADTLGLPQVVTALTSYAQVLGPCDWAPAPLLVELAERGGDLAAWDQSQRTTEIRTGAAL